MPFPNEHAARMKDPKRYAKMRRENDKFASGIHAIWGVLEDGTTEVQAIHFDSAKFTAAEAKAWLKEHDMNPMEFEPASEARSASDNNGGIQIIRAMQGEPDVDVPQRILRGARIATRRLASDGWMIDPMGMDMSYYARNPQVLAMHGAGSINSVHSPVIGRSLGVERAADGLIAATQFADTDLGREYAYLYGVNPEKQVFMRGWSINVEIMDKMFLNHAEAKIWMGAGWDDEMDRMAEGMQSEGRRIGLAKKTRMKEYSAVAHGADREALTRAWSEKGVRSACEMIARLDLLESAAALVDLKRMLETDRKRLDQLERDYQALRGEGAEAAARGDSSALANELKALLRVARRQQGE